MKQKIVALFLSILLIFSLCACGKSQSDGPCKVCNFTTWSTTIEATCLSNGIEERRCTICGNRETRSTTANNHSSSNGKCTLCGKITNAYDAFAYHISQKGDYYIEYNNYLLLLGQSYSDNIRYDRYAYYYPNTHRILISVIFGDELFLEIILKPDSTIYEYGLTYASDNHLIGAFHPSTFSANTTALDCSSTNVTNATLKAELRQIGVALAHLLLRHLSDDIVNSGLTAKDLGFANY